jgi:succinoglycan biosynthesis transport protein ExoP
MNSQPRSSGNGTPPGVLVAMGRRKWLILGCALVAAGSAFAFSTTRTPVYTAATELKYEQQVDISNPLANSSVYVNPQAVALELQSVASAVNSAQVVERAATKLGLSPGDSQLRVSTEVVPNTSVVTISASSTSARMAAAIANGFAGAFIDIQKARERQLLAQAEVVVQDKLRPFKNPVTHNSPDYLLLSQRLSDLQIAAATVTGNYEVLSSAEIPKSPSSPHPLRDGALGLVFGLFGGIAIAVAFEQVNSKPRTHGEVGELLQLPVVGRIPIVTKHQLANGPLVALNDPSGEVTESLRLLRSNLNFVALEEHISTILVTSCVQGEGKSVTASNFAITLAMTGKRIVLVDGDLRRPRLHQFFDLDNSIGLSTVVSGQTRLIEALKPVALSTIADSSRNRLGANGAPESEVKPATGPRLVVLTAGPQVPNPGELLASRRFGDLLSELKHSAVDMVLIDSPAFLAVSDSAAIGAAVDGMLLLVNLKSATRPMMAEAREFLGQLPCRKLGVIAVGEKRSRGHYGYRYEERKAVAEV